MPYIHRVFEKLFVIIGDNVLLCRYVESNKQSKDMKTRLLLMLLTLLGITQAVAQESDYLPIAREGVKWSSSTMVTPPVTTTTMRSVATTVHGQT